VTDVPVVHLPRPLGGESGWPGLPYAPAARSSTPPTKETE
jgi:hypothetical protein